LTVSTCLVCLDRKLSDYSKLQLQPHAHSQYGIGYMVCQNVSEKALRKLTCSVICSTGNSEMDFIPIIRELGYNAWQMRTGFFALFDIIEN